MPVYNLRIILVNFLWLYIFVTLVNYEIPCYKGVKPLSIGMLRVRVIPHVSVRRQNYDVTVELCTEGTGKHGRAVSHTMCLCWS